MEKNGIKEQKWRLIAYTVFATVVIIASVAFSFWLSRIAGG